jgi:chromatin licensing and DNA replication factor 1
LGITSVDAKDLKRWHPKFNLENCPDIEQSELPKPPNDLKCKTGQDLLGIAKEVYSNRIKNAINSVVVDSTTLTITENEKTTTTETSTKTTTTTNSSTYTTLLEKIKAREKTKAIQTMIINSDKEKQLVRYGQYKDTVRFISFFFQAEKKTTLELDKVANKLSQNLNNALNELEAKQMITDLSNEDRLLGKENQKWINIIKVRGLSYVKIDKSFEFNDLYSKCEQMIKDLEQRKN